MITHEWRPVIGFEGRYEVSSNGEVRSVNRVVATATGTRRYRGKALKPGLSSSGYLTVCLGRKNSMCVHVLVTAAFIGPCPDGQEVRHRDGIRKHVGAYNLHYGTRSSNIRDAVQHGTWAPQTKHAETLWRHRWL